MMISVINNNKLYIAIAMDGWTFTLHFPEFSSYLRSFMSGDLFKLTLLFTVLAHYPVKLQILVKQIIYINYILFSLLMNLFIECFS